MPMKWTAQADARMLVEILRIHKIQINYEALAVVMSEFANSTVTVKAIQVQIAKLRSASKTESRAPNGLLTPKSTPKKGAAKRKFSEDEGDDDEEQLEKKEEIKWEADEIEEQKPKIKKRRVVRAKQEYDSENMSSD